MLAYAAHVIQAADLDPWMNNIVVESALLHARSLDDFFGRSDRAKADDLIARDFSPDWQPSRLFEEQWRERINKRLPHLTTIRVEKVQMYPFVVWAKRAQALHRQLVRTVRSSDVALADGLEDPVRNVIVRRGDDLRATTD